MQLSIKESHDIFRFRGHPCESDSGTWFIYPHRDAVAASAAVSFSPGDYVSYITAVDIVGVHDPSWTDDHHTIGSRRIFDDSVPLIDRTCDDAMGEVFVCHSLSMRELLAEDHCRRRCNTP